MDRPILRRLVLAGLLGAFLWNALYYTPYVVDDAFISFRYARNLVAGHGLVYNPGEAVEGYSNLLWVLVAAGLFAAGLPLVAGTKLVGVACGLVTIVATHRLARRTAPERPGLALLATALLASNTSLALWSQAGLETTCFAALLSSAYLRFERERADGLRPGSALLFGLAWWTRPEAPIYALYFAVRRAPPRWWLTLGALVIPYELWGWLTYGRLLPHTHAAKLGGPGGWLERLTPEQLERSQLIHFFVSQGPGFALLAGAGLLGSLWSRSRAPAAAWVPVAVGSAFLLYAWSDWMPRFRFVIPFLPGLCLLLAHGLAALVRRARPGWPRGALLALLLAAGADYAHGQCFEAYYRMRPRASYAFAAGPRGSWWLEVPRNLRRTIWPLRANAALVLRTVERGETVALADIGLPGYLGMNPVWDLRGLVTPGGTAERLSEPAGRAAAIEDLLGRDTALLLFPPRPGAGLAALEAEFRADPRARRAYRRSKTPLGFFYVRRDLPERVGVRRIEDAFEAFPELGADWTAPP